MLINPNHGQAQFIEWVLPSHRSWSKNWIVSSSNWPSADDYRMLSNIDWWIPPGKEICMATCPTWVEQSEGRCLPGNISNIKIDQTLSIRGPSEDQLLNLNELNSSSWLVHEEGHSIARIPHSQQWTSSLPLNPSTPGLPNGPEPKWTDPDVDMLLCQPQTIQPGGNLAWDVVEMSWRSPFPTHPMRLEFGVLNPHSTTAVSLEQTIWIGASFSWAWRGVNVDGSVMSPGTYLGFVRWTDLETGSKGYDRCLIALAPAHH